LVQAQATAALNQSAGNAQALEFLKILRIL